MSANIEQVAEAVRAFVSAGKRGCDMLCAMQCAIDAAMAVKTEGLNAQQSGAVEGQDSGDIILAEHMAVIDAHRQKRQERRMQNIPVEVERREGWDRRARSEPMKD